MVKWLVRVLAVLVVLGGVAWIYQIEILLQAVTFAMGRMDVRSNWTTGTRAV